MCLQSSLVFPQRNAEIDVFNLLAEHLPLGSFSGEATRSDERLFLCAEESAFLFDAPCQPSRWERRKKNMKRVAEILLSHMRSLYLTELVRWSSGGETSVPALLARRVWTEQSGERATQTSIISC